MRAASLFSEVVRGDFLAELLSEVLGGSSSSLTDGEKLTLLALARSAEDAEEGLVYTRGIDFLAKLRGKSRRLIQGHLKKLVGARILIRREQPGFTPHFFLAHRHTLRSRFAPRRLPRTQKTPASAPELPLLFPRTPEENHA